MKKIVLTVAILLGLVSLAHATLPPAVGDVVRRTALFCDTVDEARSIVQATKDLGWVDGGKVLFDDLNQPRTSKIHPNEPACASQPTTGCVVRVEALGSLFP